MSRVKLGVLVSGSVLGLVVVYLLTWPVAIDPASWTPPPAPDTGSGLFAENRALAEVERIGLDGVGPEDVAVDGEGNIYGGLADGRIMRVPDSGGEPALFVDTEGRPLGLHFDTHGNLIVADAVRGLLSVSSAGQLTVLATAHEGIPFGFTDDVDIAADGLIYFTDASSKWDKDHVREDFLEHRPYGRLLVYDPATKQTRLLLDGLFFANGVAVSDDGTFLLVNETASYLVLRLWLKGPNAGQHEVFIDNLPGFPDGISRGRGDTYWVALFSPRLATLDAMLPTPWLRKIVYRLPLFLQPAPARHGFVLGLDGNGTVVANLQDPGADSYSPITSAQVAGDWLYLGSLEYPAVARIALPRQP